MKVAMLRTAARTAQQAQMLAVAIRMVRLAMHQWVILATE